MSNEYQVHHITDETRGFPPIVVRTIKTETVAMEDGEFLPPGALLLSDLKAKEHQAAAQATERRRQAGGLLGTLLVGNESARRTRSGHELLAEVVEPGSVVYELVPPKTEDDTATEANRAFAHFART